MRLNSLALQNFRQHADTRIEFDSGLTGIIGPNGSGKSTILEAIAWALYGMPAARGTRESIRSHRAAKGAQVRVELDFELGGHRYRVVRGLTTAELFLDGADQPIASSLSGVTELLRRRLGMSLEEFFNTYFTGQKELSVMAAMGPSERAQFLSRVLGYEKLRAAQGLVREKRRLLVAEINGLRGAMQDPEVVAAALSAAEAAVGSMLEAERAAVERRIAARAALEAIEPRWITMRDEREAANRVAATLDLANSESAAIARDVERLERELAELESARAELESVRSVLAPLAAARAALERMDALAREEGRRQALTRTAHDLARDLQALGERHEKLKSAPHLEIEGAAELEGARRELAEAERAFDTAREEWVRDRQEAITKRDALQRQFLEYKQQRDQLVQLGENGICPTCQRPLGTHYRTVLELVDNQMDAAQVDGKYYRSRMEQLEQAPAAVKALEERRRAATEQVAKLDRRLSRIREGMVQLEGVMREMATKRERQQQLDVELAAIPAGYDADAHAKLRAEVERLQPLEQRATRLAAQLERADQLRRDRDAAAVRMTAIVARVAELTAERDRLRFSEEAFRGLEVEYEIAGREVSAAEVAAATAATAAAASRRELESARRANEELQRVQQQLASLTMERRLHEELDRAYTDLRTDLNLQLRPEISDLASGFLTELTDGRYSELELDDQYNIVVMDDGIPKPVISGGEEDLANLVLRLSISQMIAERAGQSFSLLILDEVFGSLDESRRHNVVELLRRLHDRFEQVILITHIESVREGLDRVVAVHYDEETGMSRVAQESPDDAPMDDAGLFDEAAV